MYNVLEEASAARNCARDVPEADPSELKTFHERDLEIAKKGFRDPHSLSDEDIRQLCGVMIFYSSRLANLP